MAIMRIRFLSNACDLSSSFLSCTYIKRTISQEVCATGLPAQGKTGLMRGLQTGFWELEMARLR
jgi:hypothetical protein